MLLVQKSYWPHQQTFRLVLFTSNMTSTDAISFGLDAAIQSVFIVCYSECWLFCFYLYKKRPLSVCSLACMFSFPVDISGAPLNLFCIVFALYREHRLKSWEMTKSMNWPIKQKHAELNDCYHHWKSVVWCVDSLGTVDAKSILLTKCFEFLWHLSFIKMWSVNISV